MKIQLENISKEYKDVLAVNQLNIEFPLKMRKWKKQRRIEKMTQVVKILQIEKLLHRRPSKRGLY